MKRTVAFLICALLQAPVHADVEIYMTTHHVLLSYANHTKIVVAYDDEDLCPECNKPDLTERCFEEECPVGRIEPTKINKQARGCHVICEKGSIFGKDCEPPEAEYCSVLGGGAKPFFHPNAKLLGSINREAGLKNKARLPTYLVKRGKEAEELLNKIITSLKAHQDEWRCLDGKKDHLKIDYDLFPAIGGDHNSNSFINGILQSANLDQPKPDVNVPGWLQPVPLQRFSKSNQCNDGE